MHARSFRPHEFEMTAEGVGHLVGSRCSGCGAHYFPARAVCARCLGDDLERVALSTRGTLYSYSVVRQSTPAFAVPYVLGYVDLPERARVMAQVDCAPDDVRLGMEVELVMADWGSDDDGPLVGYRFRPTQLEPS